MLKIYFTIPFLLLSFCLMAQEKSNDSYQIINTIENYFYGYIERDGEKLKKAFDTENGTMKIPSKGTDKESFTNNYFKDIIPKWASRPKLSAAEIKDCALQILDLDIVEGKMGSAKINMKVGDTTYIDLLSLQKINQEWKITNKIYIIADK